MNNFAIKLAATVLSLFLIVYIGWQAVRYFYHPYEYETVYSYKVNDAITTKCLVVRDEVVISSDVKGNVVYPFSNGAKVNKDAVIAQVFANDEALSMQAKIKRLEQKINLLKNAETGGFLQAADLRIITSHVNESYKTIFELFGQKDLSGIDAQVENIIIGTCKKKAVVENKPQSFDAEITELTTQKQQLEKQLGGASYRPVKAPGTGYFVGGVDGMEAEFSVSGIKNLTAQNIDEAIAKNPELVGTQEKPGKIITSSDWKIALNVSGIDMPRFIKGSSVTLNFVDTQAHDIRATVEEIRTDTGVIILNADVMTSAISMLRVETVSISFREIAGVRVPRNAIHVVNGVSGVYIKLGQELRFRRIETIYEPGGDYILIKEYPNNTEYLQSFDDVVIKGKELYDKKQVE